MFMQCTRRLHAEHQDECHVAVQRQIRTKRQLPRFLAIQRTGNTIAIRPGAGRIVVRTPIGRCSGSSCARRWHRRLIALLLLRLSAVWRCCLCCRCILLQVMWHWSRQIHAVSTTCLGFVDDISLQDSHVLMHSLGWHHIVITVQQHLQTSP